MLADETLPAESGRYTASLVFLTDLWVAPAVWRGVASFLAHRGWECHLLDLRGQGDLGRRTAAVAAHTGTLPGPAVLIGHGAAAPVALGVSAAGTTCATVLVAPLLPGSAGLRALGLRVRTMTAAVLRRNVPPPGGRAAGLLWDALPPAARGAVLTALRDEDTAAIRELLGRSHALRPATVPTLVLAGDRDPLLAPEAAAAIARGLGAEHLPLEGAGHWPLVEANWRQTAGLVHRWLVQRVGEPLLE